MNPNDPNQINPPQSPFGPQPIPPQQPFQPSPLNPQPNIPPQPQAPAPPMVPGGAVPPPQIISPTQPQVFAPNQVPNPQSPIAQPQQTPVSSPYVGGQMSPNPAAGYPPTPAVGDFTPNNQGQTSVGPNPGVMPGAVMGAPQAQNTMPNFTPNQSPSSSKNRMILLAIAGVVTLGVIFAIVLILLSVLGGTSYSAKDLVTAQAQHYSIDYPKQWSNVSSNQKLLNSIGIAGSGLEDTKAYAYKVATTNDSAQSILIAGDINSGTTDAQLNQSLQDPAKKQQFISDASSGFSASSLGCKTISNKQSSVVFNTNGYVFELKLNLDCVPTSGQNLPVHIDAFAGAKYGYIYYAMVITLKSDWQHNGTFYDKVLLPTLQPKQ